MNERQLNEALMMQDIAKDAQMKPEAYYFEEEAAKFNKFIIENDDSILPPLMKEKFWVFSDREVALSNLDKEDIRRLMLYFDIAKINLMMSKPEFKLDFKTIADIDEMKAKFLIKAKRSFGPDRERVQLTTQVREIRMPLSQQSRGGLVGGLGRWFGGRK